MTITQLTVREGDGVVELLMKDDDDDQAYSVELTPKDARQLGDDLFKAACNVKTA